VLGIETSCDETAAAVVRSNGEVLSDVIESQVEAHAPYGGIVPELASRDHLRNVRPVIEAALERANITLEELDGVAVTTRPGLAGALHVGAQAALGLAFARELPIVGVDHLLGHLCAAYLQYPNQPIEPPETPFLALLVSGGHTALYRVDELTAHGIRELGATRDDAAGEAYDKVGKLLGLGYPGGRQIDALAQRGDNRAIRFPRARLKGARASRRFDFSFSGIKTAVALHVREHGGDTARHPDIAASFQEAVIDMLLDTSVAAARSSGVDRLVIAGGVSANSRLRERAAAAAAEQGLDVVIPSPRYCTDNAAMIALAAAYRLARGERDDLSLNAVAVADLGPMPHYDSAP